MYDFGPNSPGDDDYDGDDDDDNADDTDDDGDEDYDYNDDDDNADYVDDNDNGDVDNHDDPDDITLILLIVSESPSGLLLRLAASTRSSSGSASISTIGLLFRPCKMMTMVMMVTMMMM